MHDDKVFTHCGHIIVEKRTFSLAPAGARHVLQRFVRSGNAPQSNLSQIDDHNDIGKRLTEAMDFKLLNATV